MERKNTSGVIFDQGKITVSKELSEYVIPLSKEEFGQLEKNLIAEGCREPLIVWQKSNDQLVLVDGHNRFRICQKYDIAFKLRKVAFSGLSEVKIWMIDNQMGRRNLTDDQLSYYRGLKYLSLKRGKGGYENVKLKGKGEQSTSELLAEKFSVSESTVKRDAKFAEGLNIVGRSNSKLKMRILSGEAKIKKADIQNLTNAKNPERLVIKNEADLYNKSKIIREEILDEIEGTVKRIDEEKIKKAQRILKDTEPAFLDKGDRLRKIKGMIISAINRAIRNRDVQAIKELKNLIDKLADELFD